MAIPTAAYVVPLGTIFFCSGLLVNLIQAFFFITVWPFSKKAYVRINKVVVELLWLEFVWLADWWAGVKIEVYADAETFQLMGKEHALVICNHRSDIDWLVGWILAQRAGCLGSSFAVTKKAARYLPVVGWSIWFSGAIFLERSWEKDEKTLKAGFQRLKDFPCAFWLWLFVEGTRFTQAKLLAAQEYASSMGLPTPRNVLIPRTKVHVHIKRHLMKDLPKTNEAVAQWCKDDFLVKDKLLDKHKDDDSFSDGELHEIGRPMKSLVVVTAWASLLILGTLEFFQWSSLLSSWKGLRFSAAGLAILTVLMQFLIRFTQSEHSNTASLSKPVRSSLKPKI
ncbi:1-acyl-sn-glycerol-3-phosphate acyltransferase 2-like isoform X2 [Apium graveolens]|uniref:1-acyl-sn-glycerol-3-phosphate acyltransferase 2-like isoform X2 n=1 Tax=Apium graveolens TaxID=4045 RepID=UPI003D7A0A32